MVRRDDTNQPLKNGNLMLTLILGIFFAVFAGGAVTYAIARPHFWLRVDNARITFNGSHLESASAYRSSGGGILITIKNIEGVRSERVYYPNSKVLAIPNANEFSYRDSVAFVRNKYPLVDISRIRNPYSDPTMSVSNDALEFETDEGVVRVEMGETLNLDIPHNYF